MQFHPHLHVIITAGGLSDDSLRFVNKSDSDYLFPVKALSKLYRGIFIDTLDNCTKLPHTLKSDLCKLDFFCYLKEPLERADNVVKYLARYANRVCISDSRILAYDKVSDTVALSYKDNKDGGIQKIMKLSSIEFMRRFLLHTLPKRFTKIRHYGLLANRGKLDRISRCRRMLNASALRFCAKVKKCFQPTCRKCGNLLHVARHMAAVELMVAMLC
ncbi:MAG: transposase [Oscillospiraceae bacterium]|nr:transposase [Oscillospiraceae bacterium]